MEECMGAVFAAALSYFGAYLSVSLIEQYRLCVISKVSIVNRNILLLLAATALGVVAAYVPCAIILAHHEPHVKFNILIMIGALILVLTMSYLTMCISSMDRVFSKDKQELFRMLMNDVQEASIVHIRKHHVILKSALMRGTPPMLSGGLLMSVGICIMQLCLIAAVNGAGGVTYNPPLLFAAFTITAALCTLSFVVLFRIISLYPNHEFLRVICALLLSGASVGSSLLTMKAVTFDHSHIDVNEENNSTSYYEIGSGTIFSIVLGCSLLFVCLLNEVLLGDLRKRVSLCQRTLAAHTSQMHHDATDASVIAELHRSIRQYAQRPRNKEKQYKHVKVRPIEPQPLHHFVVMQDDSEDASVNNFILPATTTSHDEKDSRVNNEESNADNEV